MRVSVQDYTVYDSSLQDLSLLTLCRRSARGKRVVILRGQILVRRSGDLIDGSIMAPIQPLALGLIAALLFCYICFAFLPSAQRIYIYRGVLYILYLEDMGKHF